MNDKAKKDSVFCENCPFMERFEDMEREIKRLKNIITEDKKRVDFALELREN